LSSGSSGLVARRVSRRATFGPAFIAPYVIFLLLFGLVPAAYGVYNAFIVTPVVGDTYYSLTKNFEDVLGDYRLPSATANVAMYLAIWLPLLLIVVFGIALLIDSKRSRFAGFTRFIVYVPGAVTGSAAALLWLFMFSPTVSPISNLLKPLAGSNGLIISNQTLPFVLAVMGIAAGAGGWVVLLLGALSAIPKELIDAARVDAASTWQIIWHVKLPLLRRYAAFILIVSLANGFQVFVEPQVLGAGSIGQISSTWSVNQLVYAYASEEANFGRASALSVVLLVVTVVAAIIVIKKTNFYRVEGH